MTSSISEDVCALRNAVNTMRERHTSSENATAADVLKIHMDSLDTLGASAFEPADTVGLRQTILDIFQAINTLLLFSLPARAEIMPIFLQIASRNPFEPTECLKFAAGISLEVHKLCRETVDSLALSLQRGCRNEIEDLCTVLSACMSLIETNALILSAHLRENRFHPEVITSYMPEHDFAPGSEFGPQLCVMRGLTLGGVGATICVLEMCKMHCSPPNTSARISERLDLLYKKSFGALNAYLEYIMQIPSRQSLDDGHDDWGKLFSVEVSYLCNKIIPVCASSSKDFPLLNVSCKYLIKLSQKHKRAEFDQHFQLFPIVTTLCAGITANLDDLIRVSSSDETKHDKTPKRFLTVIKFYLTHLNNIVKTHQNMFKVSDGGLELERIRRCLFSLRSKLPPCQGSSILATNSVASLLWDTILPIWEGLITQFFVSKRSSDQMKKAMIYRFSISALGDQEAPLTYREKTFTPEPTEAMNAHDHLLAKIHFLQLLLKNMNEISDELKLQIMDGASHPLEGNFNVLRFYVDLLNQCPHTCLLQSIDVSRRPPCTIRAQTITTLAITAHTLPPDMFHIWENIMLDYLINGRRELTGILAEAWRLVATDLEEECVVRQLNALLDLLAAFVQTDAVASRISRLIAKLMPLLSAERQQAVVNGIFYCPKKPFARNILLEWCYFPIYSVSGDERKAELIFHVLNSWNKDLAQLAKKDLAMVIGLPISCLSHAIAGIRTRWDQLTQSKIVTLLMDQRRIGHNAWIERCGQHKDVKQIASFLDTVYRLLSLFQMPTDLVVEILKATQVLLEAAEKACLTLPMASICDFTASCAAVHFPPHEQPTCTLIIQRVFNKALSSTDWLLRNAALMNLVSFVKNAVYPDTLTDLVPSFAQEMVVGYVEKTPFPISDAESSFKQLMKTIDEANATSLMLYPDEEEKSDTPTSNDDGFTEAQKLRKMLQTKQLHGLQQQTRAELLALKDELIMALR